MDHGDDSASGKYYCQVSLISSANVGGHEGINHRPWAKSDYSREPLLDAAAENGGAAKHGVMWNTQTQPPPL